MERPAPSSIRCLGAMRRAAATGALAALLIVTPSLRAEGQGAARPGASTVSGTSVDVAPIAGTAVAEPTPPPSTDDPPSAEPTGLGPGVPVEGASMTGPPAPAPGSAPGPPAGAQPQAAPEEPDPAAPGAGAQSPDAASAMPVSQPTGIPAPPSYSVVAPLALGGAQVARAPHPAAPRRHKVPSGRRNAPHRHMPPRGGRIGRPKPAPTPGDDPAPSAGPALTATFAGPPGASATNPGVFPDGLSIPPDYLRLYRRAAAHAGIDWAILAAIGSIETDHGRSPLPGVRDGLNRAGCCAGPMQFNLTNGHPSTWETYATDGDGDGRLNPYSPADAIASAARKLVADGAPGDYRTALLRYNNDPAYVDAVLRRAAWYRLTSGGGPYAWPLGTASVQIIGVPGVGTHTLGNWQSDNAVDLGVPVGTSVHAVCGGVIGPGLGPSSGGLDPASRFSGLRLTLDCGANRFWYGHLSSYAPGIAAGVVVIRGQEIGRSGAANGVPHLHLASERGDPRELLRIGVGSVSRTTP